ncbi:MAG: carboxypeptidase M32 [Anaerocolumna sp.]
MNQTYNQLMKYIKKAMAFREALTLFEWDSETLAPEESIEYTSKTIGIISGEYFNALINNEVKLLLEELSKEEMQQELTDQEKSIVSNLNRTYEQMEKIPVAEYTSYKELTAKAAGIWSKAKRNNSFSDYAPTLNEIIHYQKKFASYRRKEGQHLYDILLDDFEEGFTIEKLDIFFDKVKSNIIPLLKKISTQREIDKSYNYLSYDEDKQREFSRFISEYVGFDFKRGVLAESAHPFTINLHNHDVRITTHIHENNLESSIFSVIHECGHGIYEMNIDDSITQTPVGGGSSMGVHESQSRFYENMLGRSEAFWTPIYPKLQDLFKDQLKDINLSHFLEGINKAKPSLIRTEADELTYSLHIIIRYEIEKMIFNDEVTVEELPSIWNQKYKEYLGVEPENDAEGILQDIHWAGGSFGYFPSYAIGSAVAAQIYHHMMEALPVTKYLLEGNIIPIKDYLSEHIHKYGATKNTSELLTQMMGEELNADYYVAYLTDKYTKLYQLDSI